MKPLGDRRVGVRFEIVGALWGALRLDEAARIVNISATGALIDSLLPVAVESIQPLQVSLEGVEIRLEVQVRHLSRINGGTSGRYLVGIEFLSPPRDFVRSIERLSGESGPDAKYR